MGVNNIMTEEKYKSLKEDINAALKSGKYDYLSKLDKEVSKKHGFCESTGRNVRNTKNYQAYQERIFRFHGHPSSANSAPKKQLPDYKTSINPIIVGISEESDKSDCRNNREWLIVLLVTLFGLIVVEGAIIVLFWSKYVN